MDDNIISVNHGIILDKRNKLEISGVKDVLSFNDDCLVLSTVMGAINIKGENLKITSFNNENGDLSASGKVVAVIYTDDTVADEGFFSRLFR